MHTISHHYAYTLFTHPNTFSGPAWNEGLQNTGKTKKHRKGVEVEFQNRGFEKHMKKYD
jgi:hypothetical protein